MHFLFHFHQQPTIMKWKQKNKDGGGCKKCLKIIVIKWSFKNVAIDKTTRLTACFTLDFKYTRKLLMIFLDEEGRSLTCSEQAANFNNFWYRSINWQLFTCNICYKSGSLPGKVILNNLLELQHAVKWLAEKSLLLFAMPKTNTTV